MTVSNQPKYTVKQAAQLTGLSMNQIRLWERRYECVKPVRAENGYRLYTEEDLNVLRYILQERNKGNSMQVIMRLSRSEMIDSIEKKKISSPSISPVLPDLSSLMSALKMGNATLFESHLIELQAGLSFIEAIQQNDLKILSEIGQLEHDGVLGVPCSHIASAVIRKRILSHVQNLGVNQSEHPVILAGSPDDYHEIGLLISLLELVHLQMPVMYLGANVPIDELISFSNQVKPRAIIISICRTYSTKTFRQLILKYQELAASFQTVFGGYEVDRKQALFHSKGLITLSEPSEVVSYLGVSKLNLSLNQ